MSVQKNLKHQLHFWYTVYISFIQDLYAYCYSSPILRSTVHGSLTKYLTSLE